MRGSERAFSIGAKLRILSSATRGLRSRYRLTIGEASSPPPDVGNQPSVAMIDHVQQEAGGSTSGIASAGVHHGQLL